MVLKKLKARRNTNCMAFETIRLITALAALALSISGIVKKKRVIQYTGQVIGIMIVFSFFITGL